MVRKSLLLSLSILLMGLVAKAQGPNGSAEYYKPANGKTGKALKTALFGILSSNTVNIGYDGLWDAYEDTDKRADGKIWDMYSNITNYEFGSSAINHSYNDEGQSVNREHSLPQSWFNEASPMKADIVHVFPADGYVNNRRSAYPFGETDGNVYKSANSFSKVGTCKTSGYTGTVFEPNDIYKGDIARIYFYMATRYEDKIKNWSGTIEKDSYCPFPEWQMKMFMRWAANDPVSEKEVNRNNAAYDHQQNRNPFVDYPGLEQLVWGTMTDEPFLYADYDPESIDYGEYSGGGSQSGGDSTSVNPTVGEVTFARITSTADLEVGKSYLIVCESQKVAMAASSSDDSSRGTATVTISSNEITTTVGKSGKPYEVVLGGSSTDGYTLYDPVEKTYLARTGSKNTLNSMTEASTDQAKWKISFSNNNAVIQNKNSTSYALAYNSGANMFRAYSSGQTAVQLYKNMTSTGINTVVWTYNQKPTTVRVHSLQGVLIRTTSNYVDALKDLPKGFYIINGRKIVIR